MNLPGAFFMASLLAMVLSSSEVIENFKHSLDMSSLELIDNFYKADSLHREMQPIIDTENTYHHHGRKRRSNLNLDTIKTAQQSGNREELDVKSSIPYAKVPFMSEPADIVPIEIETEDTAYAPERPLFFAIANYRNINGSYLSNVIIWRYNDSTNEFVIHQVLEEYAPYEIESFKASITPAQHKHFLAVAGYVEENDGTHPTKVSVYEIGPSPLFLFIKIQEFSDQNIRAIKYVEVQQTTYLMLGSYFIITPSGKQYNSASQVIVKRYDPISNFFHYYSSLPGSGVVDLESYTFNLKTYITVTNYRDNYANLDVFSFIYIYNDKTKSFDIMQYLPTHGARDMKHFLLSNEDYLVVANEAMGTVQNKSLGVYSDIYKFINGKYYLIQSVETYGATKWESLAVPNCMHDILLFYADQRDNIDQVGLYTFSHEKESFKVAPFSIYHISDVGWNFRPTPLSLATFSKQVFTTEESYLFLMIGANNTNKGNSVYKLNYEVFFTDSPIDSFTREVNAKLIQLNNTLEEVKKMLSNAQDALNDAVKANEDEVITGTKNFFNTVFINKGNVSKISVTNGSVLYSFSNETDRADPSGFPHLSVDKLYLNFSQLNQTINNILDSQGKFMTLDQPQNITANMTFNELLVESMDIEADSYLNIINEVEFTSVINDLVFHTEPSIIFGRKTFNCEVTTTEVQLGSLNGFSVEKDFVINNTKQSIIAPKTFKQKTIVRNNINTGFINNLNLTEEVLLSDQPGVILGENTFNAPFSAGNIVINSGINDLQISDVFSDIFTKSTDQVITGFKQFSSVFSDNSINTTVKVNNYNLQELREKIGFKENSTILYGNKIFNSTVTIETDLDVEGLVNGVDPSNYVTLSEDRNITALKRFEGNLIMKKDLAVSGKIDGMDINELVTLDSDQEIFGSKTFVESLRVSGNFIMRENFTINDVDISQLVEAAIHINNEENIDELSLDEVVIYNSTIQGMINNDTYSSLHQLYSEVLHFNGDQIVTGRKQIDQLNVTSNLYTTQLNSYNFPSDFARLNTDQIFQGQKIFEDNVVFKENIGLEGTINDIEVRRLKDDVVTLDGNEIVAGKKEFTQYVHIDGDIVVGGLVNGIDLSKNAMLLNGNQQVSAQKQFMSISYEQLLVAVKSDLDVSSTIDEIDLSDLNFAGMMISRNETITGSICFQQPNYNTSTHYINNIDLHALKEDIVTLNTDQTISSDKIFEIIQMQKNLITASTIDEIDVSELETNTVYANQTITVEGELELSSNLIIHKDLLVTGNLLSGEHVINFDNFVSKSDNEQLENLTITGNVQGNRLNISTINGLDMQKDIAYRTKQQTIDGFKTFLSASFGEIIVNGTVNNVDVTRLHEQAVFKSKDQIVKGNKLFLDNLHGKDIDSTYVNGFNITNLGLVRTEGLDHQKITATKTFHDFININNITSVIGANGVNLKEFSENLVQLNKEQTVEGETIFHNGFTVSNDIQVNGELIVTGYINGVNISNLNETTLKSNGNQVINSKTFTGLLSVDNLTVYENINGLKLPDDLLTKTTEQIVFGEKRFQSSLKTTSDVKVGKLINNVNISDLTSSSLLKVSELVQKVRGEKLFLKNISMQSVVSDGKVDGLTISNDTFVTLHTDQEIIGDKTFVESLVCKNIKVEGKIAGIDLTIFNKSRMTIHDNQTVDSDLIFINDVYVYSNITLSGLVNGIDLSELDLDSPNITINVSSLEDQLNTTLSKQCSSLTFTKASLEVGTSQLDYFTLEQYLPHKRVQHVEYFYIGEDEYIAVSVPSDDLNNQCTDSLIMKYNSSLEKYIDYQMIPTADVRKMIFFTTAWNASFLFVLNYDENCPKIKGPSQLYKWNATSLNFEIEVIIATTGATDASLQNQMSLVYIFISSLQGGLQLMVVNAFQTSFYQINQSPSRAIHTFISPIGYSIAIATRSDNISSHGWVSIALVSGANISLHQQLASRGISHITSFWQKKVLYLVVVNDHDYTIGSKSTFKVGVDVYAWYAASGRFEWFQTIPTIRAVDASVYQLGSIVNMIIVHFDTSISLFKFSYEFGFEKIDRFDLNGVRSVTTFKNLYGNQYLVLASIYKSTISDFIMTPILLANMQGIDRRIAQKSPECFL